MSIRCLTTSLAVTSVAAALLVFAPPGRAQAPRFQSGVDVVVVDVGVIGTDGNPVRTLANQHFVLRVDGKPREILSVTLQDYAAATSAPTGDRSAGPPTTSAGAGQRAPDRTFLVVLDRGNLDHGDWRKAVKAAQQFVDGLPPGDSVGVALLPASSLALRFDEDRKALKRRLEDPLRSAFGWNEGDQATLQIQRGTEDLLYNLEAVVRALARVEGPKHIVFIGADPLIAPDRRLALTRERDVTESAGPRPSEGTVAQAAQEAERRANAARQVASTERASSALSSIRSIADAAGRSRVRIHTLKLGDSSSWTGAVSRPSTSDQLRRRDTDMGTNNLASATGGLSMFPVSGATFFTRLARELSASYMLTFAPQPGDDDGRPHEIDVEVVDAGRLTVRARDEFVIAPGSLKTTR